MFAICHPCIPADAQVGLALRLLCGFGISEIADAFLSEKDTINKRLYRAKERLRDEQICIALPAPLELTDRLERVLATIYLLFNEGYYSTGGNDTLRKDVCLEAMRLALMLTKYEPTNTPHTNALMALLCFHASRFDARFDADGALVLHEDQDTTLWNDELIARGNLFMNAAANGNPSRYHIEAAIAYWHTVKSPSPTEKWSSVLGLYNQLYYIQPSPVVALNRVYAIWKVHGPIDAIEAVKRVEKFQNQFYYTLLGELYLTIDKGRAANYYQEALALAKTDAERVLIKKKLARMD
jgi:predicted RNA polymerase sigma factor